MPALSTRNSTLPAFSSLHRLGHVEGHGAQLRVRHQAARAEDLSDPAHRAHHVGSRDGLVELEPALVRDLLHQLVAADDVGSGLARLASPSRPWRTPARAPLRPVPCGSDHRAADVLIRLARIDPEPDRHLDGLVELRSFASLDGQLQRLVASRSTRRRDRPRRRLPSISFPSVPSSSIPAFSIHDVEPDAARRALDGPHRRLDRRRRQVGRLQLARSRAPAGASPARPCRAWDPPRPSATPAAFFSSTDAGGVLVTKVNDRSA